MNFLAARDHIIQWLEKELPNELCFHNLSYIIEFTKVATELAKAEHITGTDLSILQIAALLLKSGYARTYADQENAAADFASILLPSFGYSEAEINQIQRLILYQNDLLNPNIAVKILIDAQHTYWSYDDVFVRLHMLKRETEVIKHRHINLKEWYLDIYEQFIAFQYKTTTAQKLYTTAKMYHQAEILELIQNVYVSKPKID